MANKTKQNKKYWTLIINSNSLERYVDEDKLAQNDMEMIELITDFVDGGFLYKYRAINYYTEIIKTYRNLGIFKAGIMGYIINNLQKVTFDEHMQALDTDLEDTLEELKLERSYEYCLDQQQIF